MLMLDSWSVKAKVKAMAESLLLRQDLNADEVAALRRLIGAADKAT
jgi:hypothetical protein